MYNIKRLLNTRCRIIILEYEELSYLTSFKHYKGKTTNTHIYILCIYIHIERKLNQFSYKDKLMITFVNTTS